MSAPRGSRSGPETPWYARGLRFACRPDCGACCVNHGAQTLVYVGEDETKALAGHLGLSRGAFLRRFTRIEGGHRVLRDAGDACVFLDGRRCGVYEARPRQCRTFPFWPENLRSPGSWSALAEFCPGIDEGELHPADRIAATAAEHEEP